LGNNLLPLVIFSVTEKMGKYLFLKQELVVENISKAMRIGFIFLVGVALK